MKRSKQVDHIDADNDCNNLFKFLRKKIELHCSEEK